MKEILIYQTNEGGADLFERHLKRMTEHDDVTIRMTSGIEIKDGINPKKIIGLVLPGRSRGQYYRDELGEVGFNHISHAVNHGMSLMGVCAGAYVVSHQAGWYNQYKDNPNALFKGKSNGPLEHLWQNGYQSDGNNTVQNTLTAQIASVQLFGVTKPIQTIYWGGGKFIPSKEQEVKILAEHTDIEKTPAIIEFNHGVGKVLLMNIHPEINQQAFEDVFNYTPKAQENLDQFVQNMTLLKSCRGQTDIIFAHFLKNCGLTSYHHNTYLEPRPTYNIMSCNNMMTS